MSVLLFIAGIALISGGLFGKKLASLGVDSDSVLKKHQKLLIGLLIAIALLLISLIIIDKFNLVTLLPKLFPTSFLLYLGAYYDKSILLTGFFCLGFLVGFELRAKSSRQQIRQLLVALGAISFALSVLLYFLQPVDRFLGKSLIRDNVVIQTTEYTCAPSAIATLARYTKISPQLTEKEAVKLTKTTISGTNTLTEIRAMKKLGMNPQYQTNLTIKDLINLNKPALLHVKEKNRNNQGVRFSHAVALLGIEPQQQLFIIGNPYYGLQIKTLDEMKNYWFGEAILVNL
ncbi:peptidase C39 bacteriocin processing [Stanieria cyanosphaera PCC 7437]|uniref:Peptidase C39 bacteriocin processing n=1 Tax=Stanieria cyanosphaera (strain ATCC 29371 / PCC 7437) TaxID=111780 RepID=K9XUK6_STAC7|nr:cysteine peptidase family C39 domain-containing protein [Stanieria cyanosphaera]AFZ35761.1 peptidase C39 bacteriocin processing [Stanieria cyanosphaera PCC 7437]